MTSGHLMRAAVLGAVILFVACGDDGAGTRDGGGDLGRRDSSDVSDAEPDATPASTICDEGTDCPAPPTGSCAVAFCDMLTHRCVWAAPDGDGDGAEDARCDVPVPPPELAVSRREGRDCDDSDPALHPGAQEVCDTLGIDEDCDPRSVAGPSPDGDSDGDGYPAYDCVNRDAVGEIHGPDCDDVLADVNPAADESCNGRDDDCDGTADPGCACIENQQCGGSSMGFNGEPAICRRGTQRCIDGLLGDCEGAIGPSPETCDIGRLDEDCDGVANEPELCECADGEMRLCGGDPGGMHNEAPSACRRGTQTCVGGRWGPCADAIGPAVEACDGAGVDESCDGTVNEGCSCVEGAAQPCGGSAMGFNSAPSVCRPGLQTCSAGVWGSCTGAIGPGTETCDGGTDEDCDGMTDEGCDCLPGQTRPCGSGVVGGASVCVRGTEACDAGRWSGTCVGATSPGVEVCDSGPSPRDESCDGEANEGCAIVQVSAGGFHSCARRQNGQVLCWGRNTYGELGNGLSGDGMLSTTPALVAGLPPSEEIAAGGEHTCARLTDRTVRCWGRANHGQLGDGVAGAGMLSATPVVVAGLTDVDQIAAGFRHTCARRGADIWCWGHNGEGETGDGSTTTPRLLPARVTGISGASDLAAGLDFSCAVVPGGFVNCWGQNGSGAVGDGSTTTPRLVPRMVMLLRASYALSAGEGHACSTTTDSAYCWGSNFDGQVGDGTTMGPRTVPVAVTMLPNPVRISAGGFFTCAVVSGGAAWCWGAGYEGQLGNGAEPDNAPSPVPVTGLSAVGQLSAGTSHTCALAVGRVYCWGRNAEGQLGNGSSGTGQRSSTPIEVTSWPP